MVRKQSEKRGRPENRIVTGVAGLCQACAHGRAEWCIHTADEYGYYRCSWRSFSFMGSMETAPPGLRTHAASEPVLRTGKKGGGRSQSDSDIVRPKTDLDAAVPVAVPKKGGRLLFLKERLTSAEWPYDPMAFFPLALLPYGAWIFGYSPLWMLPLSFGGLAYLHNAAMRHKRKTAIQLAADPRVVKAVTKHLPSWFFDSEVDRGVWLTQCIHKLWPSVAEIIGNAAPETVKPILDYLDCKRPAFIDDIRITKLHLGTVPITICGVRFVSTSDDVLMLDLDVKWTSDSQLNLELGYKGWPLAIEVSKIILRGKVRLELGPLVPRLPILSGAVSLTFMEEPFLDFDIKVFALNVASVGMPDLSVGDTVAWVIRENVFRESTYYPNRLVFPILHDIVDRKTLKRRNAVGRLGLTIVSASNLTAADWNGQSDPYVKITYRPQNQVFRTEYKSQTLSPTWNQEFWVDIYDMKEPLLLEVKDHDVMGSSDPIGDVRLDITNIASMEPVTQDLVLENVAHGVLKVRLLFVPSDGHDDSEDEEEDDEVAHWTHAGGSRTGTPESRVLSSGPLYSISETPSKDKLGELVNVHEGSGGLRCSPASALSSGEKVAKPIPEGILHLNELRLMGYRIRNGFGTSVLLRMTLGSTTHKTKAVKGPCADPRFPETITFRAYGPDNQAGTLEVVLVERNPVTGEKVIARTQIELSKLVKRSTKTELFYTLQHKNYSYRLHLSPTFIKGLKQGSQSSIDSSSA